MESLKKPEMLMSIAAIAGVIAGSTYSYKRDNSLQSQIEEINKQIANVSLTVEGHEKALKAIVPKINIAFKQYLALIKELEERVDELETQLESIVAALEDVGAEIPKPKAQQPKKKPALKSKSVEFTESTKDADDDDDLDQQISMAKELKKRKGKA